MNINHVLAKASFGFKERLEFFQQLAALLRTGISKTEALSMTYQVASDDGAKKSAPKAVMIQAMLERMKDGGSFGDAMSGWVPTDDIMVLEAIENTDNFSQYLLDYCETLQKKKAIRSTIIGGLAYPIGLVLMVVGMMLYFGTTVVPDIAQLLPIEQWTGPATFLRFMKDFSEGPVFFIMGGAVVGIIVISILLPRWAGSGRIFADRFFPFFGIYKLYTGIGFMVSVSALMAGGMSATDAVEKIRPRANPYVKHRLTLVRRMMLNGYNFGMALHRSGTGWPDKKMNLTLRIFAETQDLALQLGRLSKDWLDDSETQMQKKMKAIGTFAMLLVFVVILGIVGGIYALQDQIAAELNG